MKNENDVSLANMEALARKGFLEYQKAEGVVRAVLFTVMGSAAFAVLVGIANDLHAPRLQLIGIVGLALTLGICGLWIITANRRALAKFKKEKPSLAPYIT